MHLRHRVEEGKKGRKISSNEKSTRKNIAEAKIAPSQIFALHTHISGDVFLKRKLIFMKSNLGTGGILHAV